MAYRRSTRRKTTSRKRRSVGGMRLGSCKCVKGRKLCRLKNGRVKFRRGGC